MLLDGLFIDKAVARAMIVTQYKSGWCAQNTGLFAMYCQVFQKYVTCKTTANGSAFFPDFQPLAGLWPLLNDKVCCCCILWRFLYHAQPSILNTSSTYCFIIRLAPAKLSQA